MANTPKRYRALRLFNYIKLGGLILVPIVLLILPSTFFDTGQSLCLSVLLLDMECYGCGLTRAVQHLIHLEFATAYEYNKMVVLVFPILVWLWIGTLREEYQTYQQLKTKGV